MWRKFQVVIQSTRSVLIITSTVALTVIVGQSLGVFNLLEWKIRDYWVRQRSSEIIADEIVIVTIDEHDIQLVRKWQNSRFGISRITTED